MKFSELSLADFDIIKNIDNIALKNYFLNPKEKNYQIYGLFSPGLSATVGVIDSIEIPAWILSRDAMTGKLESISFILKNIIDIKEKNEIFQFFTLIDDEEYDFFKKEFQRYNAYLEHIVEPGSLTGYENIDHDVLRYKNYDKVMKIFIWSLKNEYRIIKK